MTNTNFIADLELVEGALGELKQLSQLKVHTPNIAKLIHDQVIAALPEMNFTLVMQDILKAQKDGLTILPEDIEQLLKRNTTIEEVRQMKGALNAR